MWDVVSPQALCTCQAALSTSCSCFKKPGVGGGLELWPQLLWNGGRLTWAQDPTLEGPRQIAADSVGAACVPPTLPPSRLRLPRLLQPQPLGKRS